MSERLMFDNVRVQFFITYSSKEDFIRDLHAALDTGDEVITLWSRNGNDENWWRGDFFKTDGSLKRYSVRTVDEIFDGRDEDEFLYHSKVGISSTSDEQVDARPVPRVLHLSKEPIYKPGQKIEEPSMYIHMDEKDLPLITTLNK